MDPSTCSILSRTSARPRHACCAEVAVSQADGCAAAGASLPLRAPTGVSQSGRSAAAACLCSASISAFVSTRAAASCRAASKAARSSCSPGSLDREESPVRATACALQWHGQLDMNNRSIVQHGQRAALATAVHMAFIGHDGVWVGNRSTATQHCCGTCALTKFSHVIGFCSGGLRVFIVVPDVYLI